MKFKFTPGMILYILGFVGLVISLAEGANEIGSKVPLVLFFIFIMGIGIWLESYLINDDEYEGHEQMSNVGGFG
jgi:FtsH-binding integral membrane protein